MELEESASTEDDLSDVINEAFSVMLTDVDNDSTCRCDFLPSDINIGGHLAVPKAGESKQHKDIHYSVSTIL